MFDSAAYLEEFARTFVQREFRSRFVHEALKRPGKLHARICHQMNDVFAERHAGGKVPFAADEICVAITGCSGVTRLMPMPWKELQVHETAGFGLLVGALDCSGFYADSESDYGSPYEIYSGKAATPG